MGAYKYIAETLQKQYKERNAVYRAKIIAWRAGPAMVRVEKPANIARARILGYKSKQGYIVVRTRVDKGRRTRRRSSGGRKHKNYYMFVQPQLSHQAIAEQRVNRIYRNMEVLNSYWVGEDGNYKFFEIILADPTKPSVNVSSAMRQGKSFRGLTAAGNSRTPSKKKTPNKKLRRKKLQLTPYHYEPYVKKENVEIMPKHKELKKPAPKAPKAKAEAHKAPEQKHAEHKPAEHKPAHAEHKPEHKAEHAEHKPHETHAKPEHKAEHKPHETHAKTEHHAEHKAHEAKPEHKPEHHKKE
jgi:large subunit ribosomal protein L15e